MRFEVTRPAAFLHHAPASIAVGALALSALLAVDLFAYQTQSPIVKANAVQGPIHPELGIARDMSIQLKAASGAICTLSLSSPAWRSR